MDKNISESDQFRTIQYLDIEGRNVLSTPSVTNYSVLNIPPFYSGDRFLSELMARLPIIPCIDTDQGIKEDYSHWTYVLLNRKMNDYASPFVTKRTYQSHTNCYGNGYLYIDRSGTKVKLVNLDPQAVTPVRIEGVKWFWLPEAKLLLANEDVLHLTITSYDGVVGLNPIQLLAETFERLQCLQTYSLKYFKNGTQINGVIEVPTPLTGPQLETMKNAWQQRYSGALGTGGTPILPFGAKWVNTTTNNDQSQLQQLSKLGIDDVARIMRIPPSVLYSLDRATWGNIEQLNVEVVKYLVGSWKEQWENELLKLFTDQELSMGYFFKLDTDILLEGDTGRVQTLINLVNAGLYTPNEARMMENKPPIEGGDLLRIPVAVSQPLAMTDMSEAEDTAEDTTEDTAEESAVTASAFSILIQDALDRVKRKEQKALEAHQKWEEEKYLDWKHSKFADEQSKYLEQTLLPINDAWEKLNGSRLDFTKVVEEYRYAILMLPPAQKFSYDLDQKVKEVIK